MSIDRLSAALAERYRIERELGQGGMATVYLAADLKHDRKVALKVLKPELAAVLGAERFVVEIKTTASLQHPHILPLFDSGTADGFLFYVMPFIEGETLRDKLNRETQLGVDEAVRIAREVADALDYAHGKGVIHRDIKPENILIQNGRPMVADFGIALAVSAAAGGRMTETGLSLGTPHYMSPEQATADREITGRSDVYSLASVLYEMLTGNPPHTGSSAQQIIMKIITEAPQDVTVLRKSVPPNVSAALAKALEKLPADRFVSAGAFAAALGNASFTSTHRPTSQAPSRGGTGPWLRDRRTLATLALAAASVVAALTWRDGSSSGSAPEVMRYTVELDSALGGVMTNEDSHGVPAVSPDGRSVAFSGRTNDADLLIVRRLDQFDAHVIPGGGRRPFYSPDGSWLGFVRDGEIWRVRVEGGEPVPVGRFATDSWNITGACWLEGGRIVATTFSGVWTLPENGGEPSRLASTDSASGEVFWSPVPLDDSRVMVTVLHPSKPARVAVLSLRDGGRTLIPEPVVPPAFVTGDLIVFGHDPVRAVRFDRRSLALIDAPVPVPGVSRNVGVSGEGSLAWFDDVNQLHELYWVSPGGAERVASLPAGRYRWPRLSPDGTKLAHGVREDDPKYWIWTTDLRTGKRFRLGNRIGHTEPVWMPGSDRVIFAGGEPPNVGLLVQPADASRPPDVLYPGPMAAWPTDVSRDGSTLAFYAAEDLALDDLFMLTMSDRSVRRVLTRPGFQRGGRFSPDGRWFAYQSLESGQSEIHVQPWPAFDASWVVSQEGGTEPVWSRDGKRLFFRNGSRVMAVDVLSGQSFHSAPPREVLSGDWFSDLYGDQSWDVAADGRFLMMRQAPGSRVRVKVIRNWITEFRGSLDASRNQTGAR